MKAIILIALTAVTSMLSLQAQTIDWVKSIGGNADEGYGPMKPDASGNMYLCGQFNGTVDFDPGPGVSNLTSNGDLDCYVVKYDSIGNFIWAVGWGGTGNDYSSDIELDDSGNVYVVGIFWDTVDFDPGPAIFTLSSAGLREIFISKFNENGNFIWAKRIGGASNDWLVYMELDDAANICLTGAFQGTSDFDPGLGTATLSSQFFSKDIFIAKYDRQSKYLWAHVRRQLKEE